MTIYAIAGHFQSDRPLTQDELDTLVARLMLELAEPQDMDTERADWERVGDFGVAVTPNA